MPLVFSVVLGFACLGQDRSADGGPARPGLAEANAWLEKSVDEWMKMLDTSDVATRRARVGMYIGYGNSKLIPLRPVFVRALGDPEPDVRLAAAVSMMHNSGFTEADDARAIEVLRQALIGTDPRARSLAVYAIYTSPDRTTAALPALARVMNLLEDEEGDWRWTTDTFARLGARAAPAVAELVASLKSGGTRAKVRAATLLASIGEPARGAVPALLLAIRYADRDVVFACYDALRRIDPKSQPHPSPAAPFIPAEVVTLNGPDLTAGFSALERLSKVGQEAVGEIPAILRFADRFTKEREQDMSAIWIAAWVSRDRFGDALIPALLAQIRDDRPDTASNACIFLGNGRASYAVAIPGLTALLEKTSGQLKGDVATALGSIARDDPKIIPTLIRAISDPDPRARGGAIQGLQFIERPTPGAFAAVEAARKDADPRVRIRAEVALTIMRAYPHAGP